MALEHVMTGRRPAQKTDDVSQFVWSNSDYYRRAFARLDASPRFVWSFNLAAAAFGPIWYGARNLWGAFWGLLIVETFALVQLCRGLFANLGAEEYARAARLQESAVKRRGEAEEALASGADNASTLSESAGALEAAAAQSLAKADGIATFGPTLIVLSLALLIVIKVIEGSLANAALNRQYDKWQADKSRPAGLGLWRGIAAVTFALSAYVLTVARFTLTSVPEWLVAFPADRSWRRGAEVFIDDLFQSMTEAGAQFFVGITAGIRGLLDAMELLLVGTPWPIVAGAIFMLALKLAGPRVAIFTICALTYLLILGFWEKSMVTVALLGSAAILCLLIGIPLGILCARKSSVYAFVRPVLDLMQTMPSFVYLIPVIAFFGIGKPPGIIATIVFGMPPVVRLTVLGLHGVPAHVREAAAAFGASKSYLLFKVDLPLAMPSIMAGVNQTILMCLSMVVVASLIGAKGLGEEVLDALTYANEGKGVLAGIAILLCAMILDRIVQGRSNPSKQV